MNELSLIAQNIPYEVIFAFIAGSYAVSIIVQQIKKWLSLHAWGANVASGVLAFTGLGLEFLMTAAKSNPQALGKYTFAIVGLTNLAYHAPLIGVKALTELSSDAKAERARRKRIEAQDAEIEAQEVATNDFA